MWSDRRIPTLLLVSMMTVMAGATIAPALPTIRSFFADTPNADVLVRLVLTLPALFTAVGGPAAGWLVDRIGRRPVLLTSTVSYALSGAAGGAVNSMAWLLVTRAILGLSVAGIMTTVTTLIADYYDGEKRSRVMGYQAAFMGGGGVVFLLTGGGLAELSWRGPFAVYLLGLAFLIAAFRYLPEPERTGIETTPRADSTGAPRSRIALLYLTAFVGMAAFYMIPVQLPFYLRTIGVESSTAIGAALATSTLLGSAASSQFGRVHERMGHFGTLGLFFVLFGAGFAIIGSARTYSLVLGGIAVSGLGAGLMMPNLNDWIGALSESKGRGRLVGGLTTAFFLGQFVSPLLTQPIIDATSLGTTFHLVAAGLGAAGLISLTVFLRRGKRGAKT